MKQKNNLLIKKKVLYKLLAIVIVLIGYSNSYAKIASQGNFALPAALEPGPFFSFGQNIIEKNDLIISELYSFQSAMPNISNHIVTTGLLYGISDSLSLYIELPIAVKFQQGCYQTAALYDLKLQAEYAFFQDEHTTYYNQATIVGAFSIPTGFLGSMPTLGFATPSYFIGSTISHTAIDWYAYGAFGTLFIPKIKRNNNGYYIFYDFGIGHNLAYATDSWTITALFEFNGIYSSQNVAGGPFKLITGGNIIYAGPSMFFSFKHAHLQAGVQFPIVQNFAFTDFENGPQAGFEISFYF